MLQIFDKNFERISRVVKTSDMYYSFYAFRRFNVYIVGYTDNENHIKPRVYSRVNNEVVKSEVGLTDIIFCTIYFPINDLGVRIKIVPVGETDGFVYEINYSDGNVLLDNQQHYLDLSYNKRLPSIDQLKSAIVNSTTFDSRELLKKLLIDFGSIMRVKGTKKSVENFFKFLGYDDYTDERFIINDIYKQVGSLYHKTGYYQALYKYYHIIRDEQTGSIYDDNNLPNIEIDINNIDEFCEHVLNAIALANVYFTAEEQLIVGFNIEFQSNVPIYAGKMSRNYRHSFYDVLYFRHDVLIDIIDYDETEEFPIELVNRNIQSVTNIFENDKRFYINLENESWCNDPNIEYENQSFDFYPISREIFDSEDIVQPDDDTDPPSVLEHISHDFGQILHLKIHDCVWHSLDDSIETARRVETKDIEYRFFEKELGYGDGQPCIHYKRTPYSHPLYHQFFLKKFTTYRLEVTIYNTYGAKDLWYYDFVLDESHVNLEVEIYNSRMLRDDCELLDNDLTLEIDEPNLSSQQNIIDFDFSDVPDYSPAFLGKLMDYELNLLHSDLLSRTLPDYYRVFNGDYDEIDSATIEHVNYYFHGDKCARFMLNEFNMYNILEEVTVMPVGYTDTYLNIITFGYELGDELYFKVFNGLTYDMVRLDNLHIESDVSDNFYAQGMLGVKITQPLINDGVQSTNTSTEHNFWMLLGMYSGYDILEEFCFVKRNGEYINITEISGYNNMREPLNYHITLLRPDLVNDDVYPIDSFHIPHEIPTKNVVVDYDGDQPVIETLPYIRSLYPLLAKYEDVHGHDIYNLKFNDVIFAQLSQRYIDLPFDVKWEVIDSFSREVIYSTNAKTLKYRCNREAVLDLRVTFRLHYVTDTEDVYNEYTYYRQSVNAVSYDVPIADDTLIPTGGGSYHPSTNTSTQNRLIHRSYYDYHNFVIYDAEAPRGSSESSPVWSVTIMQSDPIGQILHTQVDRNVRWIDYIS